MLKFLIILTIAFFELQCLVTKAVSEENAKKPNVIIITLDALRADHLGCYGYPLSTSPFIDSLAEESFVFKKCVAQSATTVQSMAAIFTSKFPYTDHALDKFKLDEKFLPIAVFLKQRGYITIGIPGHEYVKRKFGFAHGFDYYEDDYYKWRNAEDFLSPIKEIFEKVNLDTHNFFLWIHMREPHAPYEPPPGYVSEFLMPFVGELTIDRYIIWGGGELLTTDRVNELRAAYDGNIRYADDNLRKIFNYFKTKNVLSNSIVIITADHGESLGEHNIFDHNFLYYGILHVPLIIKIPERKGRVIDYPVSSVDIFPTMLHLLEYEDKISELHLRGKNLFKNRDEDYIQFSEYLDKYSLIKKGWRLYIDNENNSKKLFNIDVDPNEEANEILQHRDIYESLLHDLISVVGNELRAGEAPFCIKDILSEEEIERLKSLGYVH